MSLLNFPFLEYFEVHLLLKKRQKKKKTNYEVEFLAFQHQRMQACSLRKKDISFLYPLIKIPNKVSRVKNFHIFHPHYIRLNINKTHHSQPHYGSIYMRMYIHSQPHTYFKNEKQKKFS